ncbi:hypothetical protein AX14_014148 [Amanita brunnescens Koide BX004]|nr:hypothetical protein AX14_014148 [Amanita brunnescens Koide BX004]
MPVDLDARQHSQDVISGKMASGMLRSPYAITVVKPSMTKPDFPSTSVSPASPNCDLTSNKDQPITLFKTVNGNAYEAKVEACHHTLDVINEGNETNRTCSLEFKDEDAKAPCSYAGHIIHQPAVNDTGLPIVKTGEGDQETHAGEDETRECSNEHFSKVLKLAPRIPDNSKPPDVAANQSQWLSQDGVIRIEASAHLRLPKPAAFTPPPAYACLRPSPILKVRLRWRPPDHEGVRRFSCYAVNIKTQPSVIRRLPSRWMVHTPSAVPPTDKELEWAEYNSLLNVKFDWRARSKPPDTAGGIHQPSTTTISAKSDMDTICSPLFEAEPLLPKCPLTSPIRADNPRCPDDELLWRARKPPDLDKCWLLVGGNNKIEDGRKRGCLPALWRTSMFLASLVHRHAAPVALVFLNRRGSCVTFIFLSDNWER